MMQNPGKQIKKLLREQKMKELGFTNMADFRKAFPNGHPDLINRREKKTTNIQLSPPLPNKSKQSRAQGFWAANSIAQYTGPPPSFLSSNVTFNFRPRAGPLRHDANDFPRGSYGNFNSGPASWHPRFPNNNNFGSRLPLNFNCPPLSSTWTIRPSAPESFLSFKELARSTKRRRGINAAKQIKKLAASNFKLASLATSVVAGAQPDNTPPASKSTAGVRPLSSTTLGAVPPTVTPFSLSMIRLNTEDSPNSEDNDVASGSPATTLASGRQNGIVPRFASAGTGGLLASSLVANKALMARSTTNPPKAVQVPTTVSHKEVQKRKLPGEVSLHTIKQEKLDNEHSAAEKRRVLDLGNTRFLKSTCEPGKNYCALCEVRYTSSTVEHRRSSQHKMNKALLNPVCADCNQSFDSAANYWRHCNLVHKKPATLNLELDDSCRPDSPLVMPEDVQDVQEDSNPEIDERFFIDKVAVNSNSFGIDLDSDDDSVYEISNAEDEEDPKSSMVPLRGHHNKINDLPKDIVPAYYCNKCLVYFDDTKNGVQDHCQSEQHLSSAYR